MLISIAGHSNKGGCSGSEAALILAGWRLYLRAPGGRWSIEAQREDNLNAVKVCWPGGQWANAAEAERQWREDRQVAAHEAYAADR